MTDTFAIGDRVRTVINLGAAWPGALALPAGSLGTISGLPVGTVSGYGVVFDDDPDRLPASMDADEIESA